MIDLTATYVERMIAHETAVRDLYRLFATAFPSAAGFWSELASEESAHADVLVALAAKAAKGELTFQPRAFNLEEIRASFLFIQQVTDEFRQGAIDMAMAFEKALAIERGAVEREFFQVFEGDSREIQEEFAALRRHTEEHASRIATQW